MVLFAAISVDGFIARMNGDTDWVKDDVLLEKTATEFGCVVMGHKTFEEYKKPPFEGVQHLVLAKNTGLDLKLASVSYVNSPENAVKKAKALGFKKLLVIGGGLCNGSFGKAGLLDEIWLDVHPILLGEGTRLLGDFDGKLDLQLISSEIHPEGFTHFKYAV